MCLTSSYMYDGHVYLRMLIHSVLKKCAWKRAYFSRQKIPKCTSSKDVESLPTYGSDAATCAQVPRYQVKHRICCIHHTKPSVKKPLSWVSHNVQLLRGSIRHLNSVSKVSQQHVHEEGTKVMVCDFTSTPASPLNYRLHSKNTTADVSEPDIKLQLSLRRQW